MKIDDVDWHADSARETAEFDGRHIGMFLRWAARRGLLSRSFFQDVDEDVDRLIDGRVSELEFVIDACDGVLVGDQLTSACADFARACYEDYLLAFGEIVVAQGASPDAATTLDAAFAHLDDAYARWIQT